MNTPQSTPLNCWGKSLQTDTCISASQSLLPNLWILLMIWFFKYQLASLLPTRLSQTTMALGSILTKYQCLLSWFIGRMRLLSFVMFFFFMARSIILASLLRVVGAKKELSTLYCVSLATSLSSSSTQMLTISSLSHIPWSSVPNDLQVSFLTESSEVAFISASLLLLLLQLMHTSLKTSQLILGQSFLSLLYLHPLNSTTSSQYLCLISLYLLVGGCLSSASFWCSQTQTLLCAYCRLFSWIVILLTLSSSSLTSSITQ